MYTKTYNKSLLRMFWTNKIRFVIIATLTAISTAIVGGFGSVAPRIRHTVRNAIANSPTNTYPYTCPEGAFCPQPGYFDEALHTALGIERISYVFPIFFVIVTCLVVFMTITRLVETEKAQIACLKTIGYNKIQIIGKYLLFTFIASLLGIGLGVIFGRFVVHPVIFNSIITHHDMPLAANPFSLYTTVVSILTLFFAMLVTFSTAIHVARKSPTTLLSGGAPKQGGKILLERIPFIWKLMPFRYKSTLRNIFRYRIRLLTTIFSMIFSTALVFAGIALYFGLRGSNPGLLDTIRPITAIIVIAAVFVNVLVIFNITNINIDERKREIATLKVLGYRNVEVSGYIFREIFITTFIGIVIGLPVGYFFMSFIFDFFLMYGALEFVDWYVWIITTVLSFSSLAIVDLLLFRKIHQTDMNSSLKTVE